MSTEMEIVSEEINKVAVMESAAGALNKSEVEAQLDAAHRYPRSIRSFLNEATTLATYDQEIAMSCIYALPRGGKVISGPSVRLAEICASAYGNLHMGARVVGIEDKEIIAQGITWDLEKNNRVTIEVRRRITNKNGSRYNDDMILMTGNAAASIGLRNAIFRVIPKAYVNAVYNKAREVAVGNASTLSSKRALVIERLTKMGAVQERILAKAGRKSVEDITLDDMEMLIGLGTAIKNGDQSIDATFPPLVDLSGQQPAKSAIDRIVESKKSEAGNSAQGGEPVKGKDEISPPHASETCTKSDFDQLEILATECGVRMKEWRKHIEETMGIAAWEQLPQSRLGEVRAWIYAKRIRSESTQ